MIDIIVIGAGVTGCAVARELSRYRWRVAVLDRASDVCEGTSKANSGIVHAGYDAAPGSRKALLNVQGSRMMEALSEELEIVCDTLLLSCGLIPENELSGKLGIAINPVTNGPLVNESLETDRAGVFACGNVLHVHDLVDHVSEEAARAGERAAAWLRGELGETGNEIRIRPGKGVRYTVPAMLHPGRMAELQTIRFRVDNVYRDAAVRVIRKGKVLGGFRKRVLAPGEMEQVVLKKEDLKQAQSMEEIEIRVEQ